MIDTQKFEQRMKEFSQVMFEQNVPVGFTMSDSGKFFLRFSFSSTCLNFSTFVELVEYVIHYDVEKGMCHQEQRPFDKLKELWNEWAGFVHSNFEMFIWSHYMKGQWATFVEGTDKQVHQWLAEHCGFLTTAEVRQVIQILKNQ